MGMGFSGSDISIDLYAQCLTFIMTYKMETRCSEEVY